MADPLLVEQFDPRSDLNPNEDDHSSYISLFPEQGLPLESAIRFQMNFLYRPLMYIDFVADVDPTFYPVMWYEVVSGQSPPVDENA